MRLNIHAIGRIRMGPEQILIDDYVARVRLAGRGLGFKALHIIEYESEENVQASLAKIKLYGPKIVLDETGKSLPSRQLAQKIGGWLQQGEPDLHFFIGGDKGHSREFIRSSDFVLSFGDATWPHRLVRVMLAEQLYRSITILAGHPYHRD